MSGETAQPQLGDPLPWACGYRPRMTNPTDPAADDYLIRSEEQLRTHLVTTATGRVRLRKRIVTEEVTLTVPVSREEITIEQEPITEENRGDAPDGEKLSADEYEVILSAERVVVNKVTVPVERVRLTTQVVTENQDITEVLQREVIEVDDSTSPTA